MRIRMPWRIKPRMRQRGELQKTYNDYDKDDNDDDGDRDGDGEGDSYDANNGETASMTVGTRTAMRTQT